MKSRLKVGSRAAGFSAILFIYVTGFSPITFAAPSCYWKFRQIADKVITNLATECKSIASMEPSNCQRIIGDRCQLSYDETKRVRENVCRSFESNSNYVNSREFSEGARSQKGAQDANAMLNNEQLVITESMASQLSGESGRIRQIIQQNETAMKNEVCAKSTMAGDYSRRLNNINSNLKVKYDLLERVAKEKRLDAQEAKKVAAQSTQYSQKMRSLSPGIGDEGGSNDKDPNWAVLGVAGAGTAVAAAWAASQAATYYPPRVEGIAPSSSGPYPNMDRYEGPTKDLFEKYGIYVDPSFTDTQKRQIAKAVTLVPECQRPFLKGLRVRNNYRLRWQSGIKAGQCLPGRQLSETLIDLNPTCYKDGISTALAVHEMFHLVANKTGMLPKYSPTWSRLKSCPVSDYSHRFYRGQNISEDFVEAARLSVYPNSGGKMQGSCTDEKVAAARKIIHSCK